MGEVCDDGRVEKEYQTKQHLDSIVVPLVVLVCVYIGPNCCGYDYIRPIHFCGGDGSTEYQFANVGATFVELCVPGHHVSFLQ